MSGSGGGGGYEYQAQAAAYIASHILAQQPLHWIEHSTSDVPVAVAEETDGPGDDINIALQDGTHVEVQVKHGLRKNGEFWEAAIKLVRGLLKDSLLYGVLLTDSTASSTIRDNLRRDLEKLGQERTDNLKAITQEFLQKLEEESIPYNPDIFRRLRIVVADLDSSQRDAKTAVVLLSQVLGSPVQVGQVWKILCNEGLNLITKKGQHTGVSLLSLLNRENIQLSLAKANSTLIERYRWLDMSTRVSKARCIERWTSLGISENDAAALADNSSAGLLPSSLQLSPGTLTILIGEMGAGKSLIGERLLQTVIEAAKENINSQIPIFLEARNMQGKSLEKAVEEATPIFCNSTNEDVLIIIDEIDEIGVSNAVKLLKEARVLIQAQQRIALLLISRPILEFVNAKESVKVHLLKKEESELLVRQLSRKPNFSSTSLPESLQNAVLCPLFAVLLASYLQEHGVWTLETKEQLLSDLVERSLRPLQENIAKARQLLEQLAAACIDKTGKAVSPIEFASWVEGRQLLDTRLVVEDADGLRFAMPILAQWFAAQHLLTNSSIIQTLARSQQRLDLWRYPLVIAIATFPLNRVSHLFAPIVVAHPVSAAEIVGEALAFQGRSLEIPSLSAIELGQHLRKAMDSWMSGFNPLASLIAPHLENTVIPTIGVRISRRQLETDPPITAPWVEIAWHSGNEPLPPVVELPPDVETDDLRGWKRVTGFLSYRLASWAWKWTLEQTISLLLQQRSIPVKSSLLSLEAAWHGASNLIGRDHRDLNPIALSEIDTRLADAQEIRCSPMMHHCFKQLLVEMRVAHTREQTYLHFPASFQAVRISPTLSAEMLRSYAEDVYRGGFEGYIQLVNALSSFIPKLRQASILPARLVGIVNLSSEPNSISISRYWEPLSEGSSNELHVRWSDYPWLGDAPEVMATMREWFSLRPQWLANFQVIRTNYKPVDFFLGVNPVTELAYKFLWEDLKKLGWVSDDLDGSGFPYTY
jgi:hypothetical protein